MARPGRQKKNKEEEREVKVELLRHTEIPCDRCGKKFEHEMLVNIAFVAPYAYTICGRCNSMSRYKKRQIINQIIQKVQDDNCDT